MTVGIQGKFWLSILLATFLELLALPPGISQARPLWIPMLLCYWAMRESRVPVIVVAFVLGLLIDTASSTALGQHSLAYLITVFFALRLRQWQGILPVWQMTLLCALLWTAYTFLMFWIDGLSDQHNIASYRWWPLFSSAVLWIPFSSLLDYWRQPRQEPGMR